jgi:hypothetical protein
MAIARLFVSASLPAGRQAPQLISRSRPVRFPIFHKNKTGLWTGFVFVGMVGIEPTWTFVHTILSRARLPVPPHALF